MALPKALSDYIDPDIETLSQEEIIALIPNMYSYNEISQISRAARIRGHDSVLRALMGRFQGYLDFDDNIYYEVAKFAILNEQYSILRTIFDFYTSGLYLFYPALDLDNPKMFRFLFTHGLDPNLEGGRFFTMTCRKGNSEVVRAFLEFGAISPAGGLRVATQRKNIAVVRLLIEGRNSPEDQFIRVVNDALKYAITAQDLTIFEYLLPLVDLNPDLFFILLSFSLTARNFPSMKRLLQLKIDPTIADQDMFQVLVTKAKQAAVENLPEFMNLLRFRFPNLIIHRTKDGLVY